MRIVYKKTSENSTLRSLMLRFFTYLFPKEEEMDTYPMSGLRGASAREQSLERRLPELGEKGGIPLH
jgi:hypothetical protein